ncbi:Hypothetical protein R9X50_00617700 [Acrodontium crateriforme]|uniref:WW domain-containing protein n=1 Tax=Acrodontium crateriforme TaxID=150365 RepID=A0AAQ3RC08_9PEZI|nr:Hypothetical protein R9X50_00617700 [Acrodontium crateriforme]
MADFAPPAGPPPPKVPEGWKAVWNDQYKEWFYVNTYTKASQWDKPTQAVYASGDSAPPGAPPGYDHKSSPPTGPEKGSNNPYHQSGSTNDDEALARKLQAEEQARATGGSTDRGASDSYYGAGGSNQAPAYGQGAPAYGQNASPGPYGQNASPYGQSGSPSPYGQQELPARDQQGGKKGLLGKIFGGSSSRPQQQNYGGGYPQQQYGGGYSNQGYPPQGYPPQGYPPQGGYYQQQQPARKQGGGMGALGGGLLGAGAGLVGGALLMDAIEDHDQNEYNQGYEAGADNGNYGGDDGGDFGGDGGGDF